MAEPTLRELLKTTVSYKDIIDGRDYQPSGHILSRFKNVKATGQSTSQPTEIYIEKESAFATIVPEKTNPSKKDSKLEKKELTLKRFATSIEVSQQFINDSAIDYKSHFTEILTQRLIKGILVELLQSGNADSNTKDHMQLLSQGGNGYVSASKPSDGIIEYELIKNMASIFFRGNDKNKSFFIFNSHPQVVDKAGNDYVTYDNLPPGAVGKLLGIPIYIADLAVGGMERQLACVLVNSDAYTLVMSDFKVEQLKQGSNESLYGFHVFQGEVWADGVVTNQGGRLAVEYASTAVKQASVKEQSIDGPKPVKRKATKIEKE
ncbi:phage major capsid protein [Bacillus cereus]|uniref:phage major capsid protein n=1 Tax=Bacillus cereus TaxID=1396 RepID=UPI000BFB69AB|nr:phage major capsid protein [Bacillus cereus]PGK45748.1 phage major capsid protein [Bacillus cereus]